MRKFLILIALSTALMLIAAEAAFNHKHPVVANEVAQTTGCYMETPDGRTVELGNLCRPSQTNTTPNRPPRFVVNDQVVSDPALPLPDPEFNQVNFLITWQDKNEKLWVANVDRVSGDFIPRSGQGQLLDTGLVPQPTIKNGPEWAYGKEGSQIAYTKLVNNRQTLSRARWTGTRWETSTLDNGSDRYNPFGSQNSTDATPRIVYKKIQGNKKFLTWREIDNPASEALVPRAPASPTGRWVEGERSLILRIKVGGVFQCAKYDVDTGTMTQLTFDAGDKSDSFMWKAPEFNNELVFFCESDNRTSIPVYRQIGRRWRKIHTIKPPSTRPYIYSPEPFVYNGKSYVSLVSLDNLDKTGPADVWIAGIDPTVSFYRQVSASTTMDRRDPEFFITARGGFIYYTDVAPNGSIIHRCDTGLGPPQ
jgi:hypothetical protein